MYAKMSKSKVYSRNSDILSTVHYNENNTQEERREILDQAVKLYGYKTIAIALNKLCIEYQKKRNNKDQVLMEDIHYLKAKIAK